METDVQPAAVVPVAFLSVSLFPLVDRDESEVLELPVVLCKEPVGVTVCSVTGLDGVLVMSAGVDMLVFSVDSAGRAVGGM